MKTRFLIIVGVACAGIIIGVLLHQQSQEFQYPRPGIYPNSEGKDILGQDTSDDPFMPDRFGKINLSRINLPPTEHNQTDYTKIGHLVSENQFKKILDEKNVQYDPDDFILIDGLTLDSYPPISGYCGYVQDMDKEDYWFSSTFRHDTLTDFEMFDQNPEPCKRGWISCFFSLQTSLAENNTKLSYFVESKEAQVGKI
ncbi:MAG: hypothetical protein HZA82_01715, partial [Thaumarchaeota archaeon]|nr:hypothetical protein [Nitrososphaerota archaeon]